MLTDDPSLIFSIVFPSESWFRTEPFTHDFRKYFPRSESFANVITLRFNGGSPEEVTELQNMAFTLSTGRAREVVEPNFPRSIKLGKVAF